MNNNNIETLFKLIHYNPDIDLSLIKIENARFNVKNKEIALKISINDVIEPSILIEMNKMIKSGIVENKIAQAVKVSYVHKNKEFNKDILEKYFYEILQILVSSKMLFKTLYHFNITFSNNLVTINVGSEDDINTLDSIVFGVRRSFELLGLDFINFDFNVDENLNSIEKEIEQVSKSVVVTPLKQANNNVKAVEKEKTYKPKVHKNNLNGTPTPINKIPSTEEALVENKQIRTNNYFLIEGKVVSSNISLKKTFKLFEATIKDNTGSIIIKTFISEDKGESEEFYKKRATVGNILRVYGLASYDVYSKDVVIKIFEILSKGVEEENNMFTDDAFEKRVELHAHCKSTFLDSVLSINEYVNRAKCYGHKALALTDKNTVQGFADFKKATKEANIKPIFGIEANYINEDRLYAALTNEDIPLKDATFVVYDVETTGINIRYNELIEIGAMKVKNGEIIDTFKSLINPRRLIPNDVSNLTHITNDDVRNAPFIEEILPKFKQFIEGCILVGHNIRFDNGHLYSNLQKENLYTKPYPSIDTMQLARARYSDTLKKFGLEDLVKAFNINLDNHHRAEKDAMATAEVFIKMYNDLLSDGITNYNQINNLVDTDELSKHLRPEHCTLLALNRKGLVNLNRLISDSHTTHMGKSARFLKSVINNHREGIIVGSSCYNGEIFETALNKSYDELLSLIDFYDYIEVQPLSCYYKFIELNIDEITNDKLKIVVQNIVKAGKEKNKIVVATGDIHELDSQDRIFRNIIYDKPLIGGGIHELNRCETLPDTHFRNTNEMLKEFAYLGDEVAYEIVVTNTNKIANMVEEFDLFPKQLFSPADDFMASFGVPSAVEDLKRITYEVAQSIYGNNLPRIVEDRLNKELGSIIKYGYGTIYYIAYLLVKHSRDAGYVVGSRGSVGSSLVATFMRITEVNSLPPHYVCPNCHFSAFKYTKDEIEKYNPTKEELALQDKLNKYDSGLDLDAIECPHCKSLMKGDGCNIPFETFLGFKGDKVPDIDLNFSGEYQAKAHAFCREIFGKENTFRGGTIGTIKKRTAENYIKDYYIKKNKVLRACEIDSLTDKIIDIKRQTGQHPGGIVVVPKGVDINEVTPVQYPADDVTSDWKTTHIDYHKFEANLLKLDILGHDDPTMMRFLMNFVDDNPSEFPFKDVEDIPLNDQNVLSMFNGIDVLNIKYEQVMTKIGSTGIPEFGTNLTKNMLEEIKPTTISDLIRISGLSHGTDVWTGNARDYFLGLRPGFKPLPISELICCRDDIMGTLIEKGLPPQDAFKIMESVRKGKGVSKEYEALMRQNTVPDYYIDMCKTIKYLFPKAHATAYVIMALRIAWFKFYKPLYFYAGFFSKRSDFFEVETLQGGFDAIRARVQELEKKYGNLDDNFEDENAPVIKVDSSGGSVVRQKSLLNVLRVALEMVARGYSFIGVNINKSDAVNFKIEGNSLIIPFVAIDSFGENTANQIVQRRGNNPFTSVKDATRRGRITSSLYEKLYRVGAFDGLPEDDEIGLFKFLENDNK